MPTSSARPPFRFEAVPLLTTGSERAAWRLLHDLPLGAHAVCPKVRLADVVRAVGADANRLREYTKARHAELT